MTKSATPRSQTLSLRFPPGMGASNSKRASVSLRWVGGFQFWQLYSFGMGIMYVLLVSVDFLAPCSTTPNNPDGSSGPLCSLCVFLCLVWVASASSCTFLPMRIRVCSFSLQWFGFVNVLYALFCSFPTSIPHTRRKDCGLRCSSLLRTSPVLVWARSCLWVTCFLFWGICRCLVIISLWRFRPFPHP